MSDDRTFRADEDRPMKHPTKPDVKPGPEPLPDRYRPCPDCGFDGTLSEHRRERDRVDEFNDRVDWWCGRCDAYIGGRVAYEGPTPVRTCGGWELH